MTILQRILRAIFPSIAPIPRTDTCLFGFYGADDQQISETADCTDVLWDIGLGGQDAMIARIVAAKKRTAIELRQWMFDKQPDGTFMLRRSTAEDSLIGLRNALSAAGVLRNINWIVPIDEPDISTTPDDQHAANLIASRIFPDSKLAAIFATASRLTHIEDYDLVGFDDYPEGDRIFDITLSWPPQSDYDRLISGLRPDQRVILVPGGGDPWRQDPARFIEQARADGRVAMLIAFLLIERGDCSPPAAGIRTNGMLETYRSVRARLQ